MGEPGRRPESQVSIPTVALEAGQAYGRGAPDEALLLAGLRRGDESAFAILIEQYRSSMTRLARLYVPNPVVAEEVVQEAWLAVVRGLSGFEGRCSLKTWLFRILINIAITRGQHERRSVPFSSLAGGQEESFKPAFDAGGPGSHHRATGARIPKNSSSLGKRSGASRRRLRPYLPGSGRSSPCGISRGGRQAR